MPVCRSRDKLRAVFLYIRCIIEILYSRLQQKIQLHTHPKTWQKHLLQLPLQHLRRHLAPLADILTHLADIITPRLPRPESHMPPHKPQHLLLVLLAKLKPLNLLERLKDLRRRLARPKKVVMQRLRTLVDVSAIVVRGLDWAVSKGARSVAAIFPVVDSLLGDQGTRVLFIEGEAEVEVLEKVGHAVLVLVVDDVLTVVGAGEGAAG